MKTLDTIDKWQAVRQIHLQMVVRGHQLTNNVCLIAEDEYLCFLQTMHNHEI